MFSYWNCYSYSIVLYYLYLSTVTYIVASVFIHLHLLFVSQVSSKGSVLYCGQWNRYLLKSLTCNVKIFQRNLHYTYFNAKKHQRENAFVVTKALIEFHNYKFSIKGQQPSLLFYERTTYLDVNFNLACTDKKPLNYKSIKGMQLQTARTPHTNKISTHNYTKYK